MYKWDIEPLIVIYEILINLFITDFLFHPLIQAHQPLLPSYSSNPFSHCI